MIKLFINLFVLQRGTLKARFLLKATVLRLRGGKRPCNLWRLLKRNDQNRRENHNKLFLLEEQYKNISIL